MIMIYSHHCANMCSNNTLSISIGELNFALVTLILHSEPNENPPEFTLTCRSMSGPVTNVVWWRDSEPVQEDSNHETSQIIVDTSENTVYHNKLRVSGREGGLYTCNVSNNIRDFVSNLQSSAVVSNRVKGNYLVTFLLQYLYFVHYIFHICMQLQRHLLNSLLFIGRLQIFHLVGIIHHPHCSPYHM